MEIHVAGFPRFAHPLELPSGFRHSHGLEDYKVVFSDPLTRHHGRRKVLVTDVSGPQRNECHGTLLCADGEDIKVVQELLRHANSRITLDLYTQATTSAKQQAQRKVVDMILPQKAWEFLNGPESDPFQLSLRRPYIP